MQRVFVLRDRQMRRSLKTFAVGLGKKSCSSSLFFLIRLTCSTTSNKDMFQIDSDLAKQSSMIKFENVQTRNDGSSRLRGTRTLQICTHRHNVGTSIILYFSGLWRSSRSDWMVQENTERKIQIRRRTFRLGSAAFNSITLAWYATEISQRGDLASTFTWAIPTRSDRDGKTTLHKTGAWKPPPSTPWSVKQSMSSAWISRTESSRYTRVPRISGLLHARGGRDLLNKASDVPK